jgi:hypothetical protein
MPTIIWSAPDIVEPPRLKSGLGVSLEEKKPTLNWPPKFCLKKVSLPSYRICIQRQKVHEVDLGNIWISHYKFNVEYVREC